MSTNIAWAFQFVWQSGAGLTVANILLTVMQSVLPLLGLYLIKLVIDAVSAAVSEPDKTAAFHNIALLILLSGGVVLFERILGTLAGLVSTAQAYIVTDRMYETLHSKSVEMDLEYYENSDYYDTLHRAQHEAPYRPTRIVNGLFTFGQSAISLIAIGVLLLSFHWSVPVFLVAAAVPGLLVRFHFAKRLYVWSRKRTPTERQALYFNAMLTGSNHAKEIRTLNLGRIFTDRFARLRSQIRGERLHLLAKRSGADLITQAGTVIPAFGLYGFIAYRALQGLVTVGDLVMFYQAVQRGQTYLGKFLGSIADLYENNLFLSNVHQFLALKPKVTEPARPKSIPGPLREGIVFRGVSFQYPGSDRAVLDDINLRIRPGEHIALVGENGSGKTTLVKLLSRLYDPTEGAITFDGIDLRELSLAELRRRISIVFQDYARYHLTVKENIWFGNIERPPEEESIVRAARQAGADDAIARLKDGYDTVLGKWFENGEELSIGEWQKVALARAFLRDAEILILDEPSSALDAKAEYEVFKKFHQLSKGRTAILISHRLSTVKMADTIYVL
ncbi:MAG: ABC transporter ATP-binding protein, partial [Candidatus Binatia bacterium]